MWRDIFKSRFLGDVIMLLISVYAWNKVFKTWSWLEAKRKQIELFHARHKCLVTYSDQRGMTGWPNPNPPVNTKNFVRMDLTDPILYFIETATRSLDVAMMLINIIAITDALIKAHRRGVKVRVLVDYAYSKSTLAKHLEDSGIEILYYVSLQPPDDNIMHYKYVLKDYSNGAGYLCAGSLNWTISGIQENYENIVFTTCPSVICAIHENFELIWSFTSDFCKNNNYAKAKLLGIEE